MHLSRSVRLLSTITLAVTVTLTSLAFASPASAATTASVSGTTLGSTLTVSSSFAAPSSGANNYMVDTEVFGPSGNRVAQWTEKVWLTSTPSARKYSWNTSGLSAGNYRIAQGIFSADWSATRSWVSNAGTAALGAPAQQSWKLASTATGTTTISIASTFTAPSNFATSAVILDTEIYGPGGTKVAQWTETATVNAYQGITRNYSWSLVGKPQGTYVVKQGVFKSDWSSSLAWRGDSAKFLVSSTLTQSTSLVTGVVSNVTRPVTETAPTNTAPTTTTPPTSTSPFWVDPSNPAARQAKDWAASRPADAARMTRIAQGGAAVWLGGWNVNVQSDVSNVVNAAASVGKTPVFVAYNIPGRDCGSYSAGGANGSDAYRAWIGSLAAGVGDKKAWVVLEPDALAQLDCLSSGAQADRLSLLSSAVSTLEAKPNLDVYIDAGHPGWLSASTMAGRLRSAGVDKAKGFSLNVSNFVVTKDNVTYGESISSLLNGKRYVVDTSRNGNGSNTQWCNPSGRAVGETPTVNTGAAHADAFLWIKRPGESDGTCNGGPSAGQWWADYALGLATSAWG